MNQPRLKDTNGTLSVIFAASIVIGLGPVGGLLAIVLAVKSRRELGYRSTKAWIGLIVGSLVLALCALAAVLIVWFEASSFA